LLPENNKRKMVVCSCQKTTKEKCLSIVLDVVARKQQKKNVSA